MATCPTCGAEAQVGQRFCAECGTKLTAGRPRVTESDGSNAAPRRPADIGAGGFRWNASAPTPPSEVVSRAREEAAQAPPSGDGDDFFARYRPKAAPSSPSAPGADDDAPEQASFLRSRRRFNPDLRATGERSVVPPRPDAPTPRPAQAAPVVPPVASPPPAERAQELEPPAAPAASASNSTGPVRDAFAFEPPTTEFDVLPMGNPPARAEPVATSSQQEDAARGQVPSWFSDLDGGDPPKQPQQSVPPQTPPAPAPSIPAFRAEPPAAPTPRVVPSAPPMPASGDPFRGASAAPVFPSGPAVVPGEPPRVVPAQRSEFDELLAGERSDGSVLDDSDRPIVSRDFEQTGIVPLPSRTRESFGGARPAEQQDAAELFRAPAAQAPAPSAPVPSAPAPAFEPEPEPEPVSEPATRTLPRQDPDRGIDRGTAAASPAPSLSESQPAGPSQQQVRGEGDPARELLSSWFEEDETNAQAASGADPRAPRGRAAASAPVPDARVQAPSAPAAPPQWQAPEQAPAGDAADQGTEPDIQPSGRNPFDRVGAALGGGSGGGGGRFGQAVRGLDNRDRRRLGVIALSVVGSILLILSAIMIGNVVGANRGDASAEQPTASETTPGQPETPAVPPAVADPSFQPVTFTSETGNIRCQITPETGVACQQYTVGFEVPDEACEAGATGVVVGLDSNGYTFPCLTEDIPTEGAVVQPYDSPVVLGEFVCEITFETGVTCFNAAGDIVSVEYSAGVGQAGRLSATNPTPAAGQ